jgi:hypothetical protein
LKILDCPGRLIKVGKYAFLPQKFWALWKNPGTCKILCSLEGVFTRNKISAPTSESQPFKTLPGL